MTTQTEQHVHTADCGHSHSQAPYTRENAKIGRNEPCPCQSGKKFKKCCGANPA